MASSIKCRTVYSVAFVLLAVFSVLLLPGSTAAIEATPSLTGSSATRTPVFKLVSPDPGVTRIPLIKPGASPTANNPVNAPTLMKITPTAPQQSLMLSADWLAGDCISFIYGDPRWVVVKGTAIDFGDDDFIMGADIEVRFNQGSAFDLADVSFTHKMVSGSWVTHYATADATMRYYWSGRQGPYDWYYTGGSPFDPYLATTNVTFIYQTNGTGYLKPRFCGHGLTNPPTLTPTGTAGSWSVGLCSYYAVGDPHWIVVKGTPVDNGDDDYVTGADIEVRYERGSLFKMAELTFIHAMSGGNYVTHYARTDFDELWSYWTGGTGGYG